MTLDDLFYQYNFEFARFSPMRNDIWLLYKAFPRLTSMIPAKQIMKQVLNKKASAILDQGYFVPDLIDRIPQTILSEDDE